MARGRFVVFEGIDGSGKTTQLARLAAWLRARGVGAETTVEPSAGPIGAVLRQAIDGHLQLDRVTIALAFAADRADHLAGIRVLLDRGRWVLCDRYVLSSLAYQRDGEVTTEWVRALNEHALEPDVTVFVDTSVSVAAERIGRRSARPELFHGEDQLRRTRDNYLALLETEARAGHMMVVDGDGTEEAVFEALLAQFGPWFASAGVDRPGGVTQ